MPESHCPEEIEDLRQWSLMGDGVRTRIHVILHILELIESVLHDITVVQHRADQITYHEHISFRFSRQMVNHSGVTRIILH